MDPSRLTLPVAGTLAAALLAALPVPSAIAVVDVTVPRVAPQTMDVDFTHAAFLDGAGKVWTRGGQDDGALGNQTTSGVALDPVPAPLPPGVSGTKVDVGERTTVVLGDDGRLYGTGKNGSGQLTGAGDRSTLTPFVWDPGTTPQALTDVATSTSGPEQTTYAIGADGTLYFTGSSPLAGGTPVSALQVLAAPLPAGAGTPTQVVAGTNVVLVVTANHRLYGLGLNDGGRLGVGLSGAWNRLDAAGDVSAAIAGARHTAWLTLSGTITSLGSDAVGQFGDGAGDSSSSTPVTAPGTWTAIAGTNCECTVGLAAGVVKVAGRQPSGYADLNPAFTAVPTAAGDAAVEIAGNDATLVARRASGEVWGAGRNTFVQVSDVGGSYSASLVPVNDQPVVPTAPTAPTGAPIVGAPLGSGTGSWVPTTAVVGTQWFLGSVTPANLVASTASFTPEPANAGQRLFLVVTATGPNLVGQAVESDLGLVAAGTLGGVADPLVAGTAAVGSTLTASSPVTTPASEVAYAWLRDGVAIAGASAAGYQLTRADAGRSIVVRTTATAPGYAPAVRTSTARRVPAVNSARPTISGTAKKGKLLRATKGTWSGYGYGYTALWYRNGVRISAKPAWTYRLRAKDRGTRITVRVQARRTGWTTVTATSKAKRVRR